MNLINKHELKGLKVPDKKLRENATSNSELDSIFLYEILKIVKQIKHEIFQKKTRMNSKCIFETRKSIVRILYSK